MIYLWRGAHGQISCIMTLSVEQFYLEICLEKIQERFQWGPVSEWTNYNYTRLGSEIQKASGTTLSPKTLKRLFKNYKNINPQSATKDAMAIYLGFKDWEDFKNSNALQSETPSRITPGSTNKWVAGVKMTVRNFWFYMTMMLILLIVLSLIYYTELVVALNKARVEFTTKYVPGIAPQEVIFYYDVTRINSTSIFVDQNFFREGGIAPLGKNRHYLEMDLYLPDLYSVRIIANGEWIARKDVLVTSINWDAVVNVAYLGEIGPGRSSGKLSLHPDTLRNYSAPEESRSIQYMNIREFSLMGDHMKLQSEFRVDPEFNSSGCVQAGISIVGVNGRVGFDFVNPGCSSSLLNVEAGEVQINGEFRDLSALFVDFTDWRKVTIDIEDMGIRLEIDDELAYKVQYHTPLDSVRGIVFRFNGLGEVNYVELLEGDGSLNYKNDFQ